MSSNMLNDMDFEQKLNELGDNQTELIKFIARQQYDMSKVCPIHDKRLKKVENRTRKEAGITGGAGAVFGGLVMGAIDYFLHRG